MTEAASTSETLTNFYQTIQRSIPEVSHLNSATTLEYILVDFVQFHYLPVLLAYI
jgi:hypothetical protein